MQRIVFLDRITLPISLPALNIAHEWQEFATTRPSEVVDRLHGATIAITNKVAISNEHLAALPALKMIAVAATGTDIIDKEECQRRGVWVDNIRNYAGTTVPEHVFALILALRRRLFEYHQAAVGGAWSNSSYYCVHQAPIHDLRGSILGIIGYGYLGRAVADLGRAFGMQIWACGRTPVQAEGVKSCALDELLSGADVVSLHAPMTEKTKGFIGAQEMALMKSNALLINVGRGALIDESALLRILQQGRIGGAALDVLSAEPPAIDHPLLKVNLPNLLITPHVAWASQEAMQSLGQQLIDNIEAFVRKTPSS